MKETLNSLVQELSKIVNTFVETNKKHNEVLEKQSQILTQNTINKECKSKIYEELQSIRDVNALQKIKIEKNEKDIQQLNLFLKGDGCYSKGLITEIKELKNSINELKDFVKESNVTKKNIKILYNVLSGAGGAVLLLIIQKLL